MGRSYSLFSRMKDIIYKQVSQGQCWSYSILNALQLSWIKVTEQEVLSWGSMLSFPDMSRTLKKHSIWTLGYLNNIKLIESFLKRWHKLIALIYRNNFKSVRNAPYLQDFRGNMNHFVCLIEDCWDKIKYRDSQWEGFADWWNWYISKNDFTKIKVAVIHVM